MSGDEININAKFFLRLSSWYFKPTLKLSIISLTLFIILVYLGAWQIGRSVEKKNIFASILQKSQRLPIALSSLSDPSLKQDRFTAVTFDAIFINELTFLLDNQMQQHQAGYRVITPAKTLDTKNWVLVDRGWIPLGNNRQEIPSIEVIDGIQQVSGIINHIPSGIVLHKDVITINSKQPFLMQSLDYALLNRTLPNTIFDFVVQLQSNTLTNYVIPELNFGISSYKHLGYAAQWYLFATLVLIYYLIASIKKGS